MKDGFRYKNKGLKVRLTEEKFELFKQYVAEKGITIQDLLEETIDQWLS